MLYPYTIFRRKYRFLLWLISCLPLCSTAQQKLNADHLQEIVHHMTLDEKVHTVVGMGMYLPPSALEQLRRALHDTGMLRHFHLPPMDTNALKIPEKVPGAAGRTYANNKWGIPSLTFSDGPAGVRINPIRNNDSSHTYYATAFPVATLLASSWDTACVYAVGQAIGNEVKNYGIDVLLGPGMNIQRNPLCGRNFEYYSEDPLITGEMAAAMVSGIQSNGVGTSIKHFACNNQETNRNSIDVIISERALREIYLRGFEIAVKQAHPWTVMSSYNKINGTYTSEQPDLLTTILREEWGFKGLVMTDWFGGHDPVAQMRAGNNLLMPGTPQQMQAIEQAVREGKLDTSALNRNVEQVLKLVLHSPTFHHVAYSDHPDLRAHARVARWAAAQGMVLLKNEHNSLPIAPNIHRVALFGTSAYHLIPGGTGSGTVHSAYTISLNQGLHDAGLLPDASLQTIYQQYIHAHQPRSRNPMSALFGAPPIPEMPLPQQDIEQAAARNDMAILSIGRESGEGADRHLTDDFELSDTERALISEVCQAFHALHKPVVVVLNIGGVIETASWNNLPDAILLAWQPGEEGGHAIADVLTGKVNPSGRLAVSFPLKYADEPSASNFPGTPSDNPQQVVYQEGIYVGYRYFNTFHVPVAYPFGYGLSYTTFRYDHLQLNSHPEQGRWELSLTVTNTGKRAGREVVQIYVHAPTAHLDKPELELKKFAKTSLLAPGQSQTLHFILTPEDLASFDPDRSAWIADAGTYELYVGKNATTYVASLKFNLPHEVITERVHRVMQPEQPIQELHPSAQAQP
ncbi:MAG: glycoside hydrolase family 3 C-terminal domain-containing protein [Thermoflavifilum sp.]|nr:glycoside hydrolase family 3 C-terminal domain-containing protein [Thermoflavifilum sp.]